MILWIYLCHHTSIEQVVQNVGIDDILDKTCDHSISSRNEWILTLTKQIPCLFLDWGKKLFQRGKKLVIEWWDDRDTWYSLIFHLLHFLLFWTFKENVQIVKSFLPHFKSFFLHHFYRMKYPPKCSIPRIMMSTSKKK